ncbi:MULTISPECIES: DUF3298 and DUF4163 domain-containing protein [Bacillus]|uniref:DUF3298 and DUF4163 domain-containing protein n=1 Tax=Bacillus TaxID=1386 RepID=UPI001D0CED68|nr:MULTISPECIES: DUF3298 and DUF4163 domain-containing protein [Bacillus]
MFTFIPPAIVKTGKQQLSPNWIVYFPVISGIQNRTFALTINREVAQLIHNQIKQQTGEQYANVHELYSWFGLKTNELGVLSLTINNYTYFRQAAHGLTVVKSLTFDTERGKKYTLAELFKPGSNYVGRISKIIKGQIEAREIPTLEPFTKIKPDQDFYIADKLLVVYFQAYEISPYVVGLPMFPINVFDLQDILNEEGPLAKMATNS